MWCILISGGGQDRWCTGLLRLKLSDKKTAQVGMLRGCPRSRRSVTAHPRAKNLTLNKATRQVQNDGTLFSARQSDQLAFRFAMLPYTPDSTELVTTKNLRRCSPRRQTSTCNSCRHCEPLAQFRPPPTPVRLYGPPKVATR